MNLYWWKGDITEQENLRHRYWLGECWLCWVCAYQMDEFGESLLSFEWRVDPRGSTLNTLFSVNHMKSITGSSNFSAAACSVLDGQCDFLRTVSGSCTCHLKHLSWRSQRIYLCATEWGTQVLRKILQIECCVFGLSSWPVVKASEVIPVPLKSSDMLALYK